MNTNHYSILAHLMLSKITDINLLIIQLAIALIEHKVESQNTEPQTTEGQYKKG